MAAVSDAKSTTVASLFHCILTDVSPHPENDLTQIELFLSDQILVRFPQSGHQMNPFKEKHQQNSVLITRKDDHCQ